MPSPNQALYNKIKDLLAKGILPNPNIFKTLMREELIELKAWVSDTRHRLRNEEYQRKTGFRKPEVLIGLKPLPSTRSLNPKIDILRRALRLLDIELNKEPEKTDGSKNNLSDMIKQWFKETAKDIERFAPERKEKALLARRLPYARHRLAELESELDTREHPPTKEQRIGERGLILLRAWVQAWREYVSALEAGNLIEEPVYNKVIGEQAIIEDLKMVSLSKKNPLYGKLRELMSDTGDTLFKIAKRGKPELNFTIFYRPIEEDFKIADPEIFRGEHLKVLSELAMLALTGNLKESDVKISSVESIPLIERIESQMKAIKKQLPILSVPKMEIKWKSLKQAIHGHLLESGIDPSETTIHDVILEILKQNEIATIKKKTEIDEKILKRINEIIEEANRIHEIQLPERQYLLSLSSEQRRYACEHLILPALNVSAEQIYAEVWDNDIEHFIHEDLLPSLEKEYGIKRKQYFAPLDAPAWILALEKEVDFINLGRYSLNGEATPFDNEFFYQIKPEKLKTWYNDLTTGFKEIVEKFKLKRRKAPDIKDRLVLFLGIYAEFLTNLIEYPSLIFSTAFEQETLIDSLIASIEQLFSEEPYQRLAEQYGQEQLLKEIQSDKWDKEKALKLFTYDWEDWVFIGDWNKQPHKYKRFLRLLPESDLKAMLAKLEPARASTKDQSLLDRINRTYALINKSLKEKPSPLFRL